MQATAAQYLINIIIIETVFNFLSFEEIPHFFVEVGIFFPLGSSEDVNIFYHFSLTM
jgi:hypothetical protein